jgi:hypothetical protein
MSRSQECRMNTGDFSGAKKSAANRFAALDHFQVFRNLEFEIAGQGAPKNEFYGRP